MGGALTVADTALFDLVDLHVSKFGADKLNQVSSGRAKPSQFIQVLLTGR